MYLLHVVINRFKIQHIIFCKNHHNLSCQNVEKFANRSNISKHESTRLAGLLIGAACTEFISDQMSQALTMQGSTSVLF